MTEIVIFSDDFTSDPELLAGKHRGGAIPLSQLEENIQNFAPAIKGVLKSLTTAVKENELSTVSIKLGINAKGTIGFLGNGAQTGGEASITLNFNISKS